MAEVPAAPRQHDPRGTTALTTPASPDGDSRQVYRVVVDVLAAPEQVAPLVAVVGTAICGRPDDHAGPCRVAWRITVAGGDHGPGVTPAEDLDVRRSLAALEAWPTDRATADLLAEAHPVGYAEVRTEAGPAVPSQHGTVVAP